MTFAALLILADRKGWSSLAGEKEDAFLCGLAVQTPESAHFSSLELTHIGVWGLVLLFVYLFISLSNQLIICGRKNLMQYLIKW